MTCDRGYTKREKTSETFKCEDDGSWSGGLTCEAVPCAVFENQHTVVPISCRNVTALKVYPQSCEVQCEEGYTFSAPKESRERFICDAGKERYDHSGSWSGSLTCQKVDCGNLVFPHDDEHHVMLTKHDGNCTTIEDVCHTQAGTAECEGCHDSACCDLYYVEDDGKKYNCNWSGSVCSKSASPCYAQHSTLPQ